MLKRTSRGRVELRHTIAMKCVLRIVSLDTMVMSAYSEVCDQSHINAIVSLLKRLLMALTETDVDIMNISTVKPVIVMMTEFLTMTVMRELLLVESIIIVRSRVLLLHMAQKWN